MYISKYNKFKAPLDKSLRELLQEFMKENKMLESSIAEEIGVHKATFSKYIKGEADLKFMAAIRLMKLLNLTESQLVSAYCIDIDANENSSLERLEHLSYITRNFDIPTLKKIGIIKSRAKVNEYEECICNFFGFSSIYEYEDTSLMPTLFSKSKQKVLQEKEAKMTSFWLKCAISSFHDIGNPYEYNKELLLLLLKRSGEFTKDEKNGYIKFVLVLYQLGITVLTQSYTSGTKAFGATMILDGKPCIIITDMKKKYHKLWISLLHELYHVVNDFEVLETITYHLSNSETRELLLNEEKANQFALDILIHPSIQSKLQQIIAFPYRVNQLAAKLNVSPSIVYGVYLESLPNGRLKSQEFKRYNHNDILLPSEVATKNLLFDPVSKRSLMDAIEDVKKNVFKNVI